MEPTDLAQLVADRKAGAKIDDMAEQSVIHRATVINHLDRAGLHLMYQFRVIHSAAAMMARVPRSIAIANRIRMLSATGAEMLASGDEDA